MDRDRDRERYEASQRGMGRRHGPDEDRERRPSPNFRDEGQRWESAGGHRASNRDWHGERDTTDMDYGNGAPGYGVGAEAAYGVPADERYFAQRYGARLPRQQREDVEHESEWERINHGRMPKPGYKAPASGQITQGGFWAPDLDGSHRGPVTGDELRGHGHFLDHDHDYVSWRDDQLNAHDRDYWSWREEQRRAYDSDYANWRRERQDRFGKDFSDWRTQRTQGDAGSTAPSSSDADRRSPLTASRPGDDKKKQDG